MDNENNNRGHFQFETYTYEVVYIELATPVLQLSN